MPMSRPWPTIVLVFAIVAGTHDTAGAEPLAPWRLALAGGVATDHSIEQIRLSLRHGLGPGWRTDSLTVTPQWELAVARWEPSSGERGDAMGSVSLRLVLRIASGGPWFAEAGTGPMYISDRETVDGEDWGLRLEFDSHVGVGAYLDHSRQWALSYQIHHASNASLGDVNPGVDYHLLALAWAY
ncbi:acyloxyacyl hydrolase [Arhodomonas sp. AD133]|uniref:acyloxyacyl hydrolase n=1 Tax=Arhodomonas sp. AD133 TaxID=3415009 RepID=UPI003EB7C57F